MTSPARGDRPATLVFFLLHPGLLRFFGSPVEALARRGHRVVLAFSSFEKDAGDAALAEELAARLEGVVVERAPERSRRDGLRALSGATRLLVDASRYADPRFAGTEKLRARVVETARRRLGPGGGALARLLVRRPFGRWARRILIAVERATPTAPPVDVWLRARHPDAVLVSPLVDFGSPQVDFVKSAQALGIPAAVCVASWDNLTNKGLLRVAPDALLVWNETQAREAVDLHDVPAERVVVTGAPKFDEWFDRAPSTTVSEFAAKVGVSGPFLLYLCSSPFVAPDEVAFVRDWLRALRDAADEALAATPVIVRPHPQNSAQWRDIDLSAFGDSSIWPPGGAQPDAGEARADFYDSLAHARAVIGVNTSGLIEAAIVGRPVFTILDPRFAATQEGTLHFHYLLREHGGFLRQAHSLDEHLAQLADSAPEDPGRTREFVRSFVRPHGLHRPATAIFADAVEELARRADPRAARSGEDRRRVVHAHERPAGAAKPEVGQ